MNREPNMRVEVSRSSIASILSAGGCVSYLGTGNASTVYAEGKPAHLNNLAQMAGVKVVGEIHKSPKPTLSSGEQL